MYRRENVTLTKVVGTDNRADILAKHASAQVLEIHLQGRGHHIRKDRHSTMPTIAVKGTSARADQWNCLAPLPMECIVFFLGDTLNLKTATAQRYGNCELEYRKALPWYKRAPRNSR